MIQQKVIVIHNQPHQDAVEGDLIEKSVAKRHLEHTRKISTGFARYYFKQLHASAS